jgi:uncharacterized NAD(P)/FAD-binding protein YdhS
MIWHLWDLVHALTIIHFIDLLEHALNRKVKILVIDKAEEFWVGIPYGNRSGLIP